MHKTQTRQKRYCRRLSWTHICQSSQPHKNFSLPMPGYMPKLEAICKGAAVGQCLRHWTFTKPTTARIPLSSIGITVASGRASGQNCSGSPEKSHLLHVACPSLHNEHDVKQPHISNVQMCTTDEQTENKKLS